MKAAVFKAAGSPLVVETVPDPEPRPSDLILKVRACGICGTDLHWSANTDPDVGWRVLKPGAVMGHEFAGEVVEIGRDLRGQWSVGDRVTAQPFIGCGACDACRAGRAYLCRSVTMRANPDLPGAYAEYTRVGAGATLRLPEGVGFREGALVEPLAVGLNAVNKAGIQPGDSVLIIGAGPVGLSVALWAEFFGARKILVSDLVAQRAQAALDFGATHAIDASVEDVKERARAICGHTPRIVFDCVGVPGSLQLAIDYAPQDGRVVVVGLCMAQDRFFPTKALTKELDLAFAFVYRLRDFEMVVDMLDSGRIAPLGLVTAGTSLDGFPDAFERLKTPSDQIKVMLEPH